MSKISSIISIAVLLALLFGVAAFLLGQSALPPAKQAIEQQYTEERAAGAQNPAPINPDAPYPITPAQPFITGIGDNCDTPGLQGIHVENCWQGMPNGIVTYVYAGADKSDVDQGLVLVELVPDYPSDVSFQQVLGPVRAGALRIVAWQDNVLTLVSATGHYVLTFDVSTKAFTSIVIDDTPPVIAGMPTACILWPPNHTMVQVATVTASDAPAGLYPGSFIVTGTSNEPSNPKSPDIVITPNGNGGFVVQLRAERLGNQNDRVYTLTATATDQVGNTATVTSTCTVPHDQGR